MEGFRDELVEQGLDVHIVAINSIDGLAEQQELTSRCSFPLLQDHADVRVWEDHHQADKDDMLIYDAAGVLYDYFPAGGDRTTNLKESQGRQNLIEAIVGASG
jgi:hypothetical protein